MKDKYQFPDPPKITVSNAMYCGVLLHELAEYIGKYQISFQFWGEGNNNVFIEKDGVELESNGGHETPLEAMIEARNYLDRINKKHREYNPDF